MQKAQLFSCVCIIAVWVFMLVPFYFNAGVIICNIIILVFDVHIDFFTTMQIIFTVKISLKSCHL